MLILYEKKSNILPVFNNIILIHSWIMFYKINFQLSDNCRKNKQINYKKGNYGLLNQRLISTNWNSFFQIYTDVNCQWNAFKMLTKDYMLDIFPYCSVKSDGTNYPRHIKMALSHKKILWRRRFSTTNGLLNYNRWAKICKKMIHKHNVNNELNIIHSRSAKNFLNYANKKLCSHSKLGPLIDTNGICQTDDQTKCEILNEFFSSAFTNDNGILPMVSKQTLNISSNKIDFSQSVIIKAIKKLKASGSAGPDLFPALFWRNAAPGVALPLSIIFSNSFALSTLPDEWRLATVISVFKKGSPSNQITIDQFP